MSHNSPGLATVVGVLCLREEQENPGSTGGNGCKTQFAGLQNQNVRFTDHSCKTHQFSTKISVLSKENSICGCFPE